MADKCHDYFNSDSDRATANLKKKNAKKIKKSCFASIMTLIPCKAQCKETINTGKEKKNIERDVLRKKKWHIKRRAVKIELQGLSFFCIQSD